MNDLVRDLLFRASDQDGIGRTPTTVVPVPAGLLHRAADEIERMRAALLKIKRGSVWNCDIEAFIDAALAEEKQDG